MAVFELSGRQRDARRGSGLRIDATGSVYVAVHDLAGFPDADVCAGDLRRTHRCLCHEACARERVWRIWTHQGGSDDDVAYGMGIDGGGNAFVTGLTSSTNSDGERVSRRAGRGDDASRRS